MAEDLEQFTINNVNKISLALLENSQLKHRYLDDFLLFILKSFSDEAECLSKLKVLDTKRLNNRFSKTTDQIFSTVLSIKDVQVSKSIESTTLFLTTNQNKKLFNRLAKWYFLRVRASKHFVHRICTEIFLLKNVERIKEIEISEEEEETSSAEEAGLVDGRVVSFARRERKPGSGGLDSVFRKKKGPEKDVVLGQLLKVLEVVVEKSRSSARDFYSIATLLRIRNRKTRKVINLYFKNLRKCPELGDLFLEGLETTSKMIMVFPQVYRKATAFDWTKFVGLAKKKRRIDLEYLRPVAIPPEVLGQVLKELKNGEEVVKAQIKKMDLAELSSLGGLENTAIQEAVRRRVEFLKGLPKAE